jgi:hypothetical protein
MPSQANEPSRECRFFTVHDPRSQQIRGSRRIGSGEADQVRDARASITVSPTLPSTTKGMAGASLAHCPGGLWKGSDRPRAAGFGNGCLDAFKHRLASYLSIEPSEAVSAQLVRGSDQPSQSRFQLVALGPQLGVLGLPTPFV